VDVIENVLYTYHAILVQMSETLKARLRGVSKNDKLWKRVMDVCSGMRDDDEP
jgi:hypothetical protein